MPERVEKIPHIRPRHSDRRWSMREAQPKSGARRRPGCKGMIEEEGKVARGVAFLYFDKAAGRPSCPNETRQTQRGCTMAGAGKGVRLAVPPFIIKAEKKD